jgi:glyoxylase-like metal-dependent hydrolase (beta-lactamase superfamily II)
MPQIYRLEKYSTLLKDVALIIGDGLCSNIYIFGQKEATIIDTGVGNRSNPIFPQLNELGIKPENIKQVILTHAHHDHAMGTYLILQSADPRVFVHEKDIQYVASSFEKPLIPVKNGETIETELFPLTIHWTPGHTEGSICLYNCKNKLLVSGDTVFPDGYYGRYDGESGSLDAITESLRKLTQLDCEIMLPGHGSPVFQDANTHILLSYNQVSRSKK